MRKAILLFIPLLLILSCKKTKTLEKPEIEPKKPEIEVDMSNPLENVIQMEYQKSSNAIMYRQTDIAFLGFLTDTMSVRSKQFNPFNNVVLINNEYSLTDINSKVIERYKLDEAVLSNYRESYNEMLKSSNYVFTPKISYQIHATKDLDHINKTEITLVVKAIYYYLVLSEPKQESFRIYSNLKIDEIKQSGAYLSRIGFGLQSKFQISTYQDPNKLIPYLKAYLNAVLNGNEKNAAELREKFEMPITEFEYLGGPISDWFQYQSLSTKEKIEKYVKELFVAKPTNSAFKNIEFEFKALK
ncbi:hypothetical protein CPT03_08700 [Pedobacter ginsengisoli]|uniref:Uncharacterized protein n=1 Tax=Pedobacter ginsengisoli TaxID=363852 RepID=A0A2D1U4N8_9SPHI|nr:hypothetical protein [Pedobacter ginsengisoli]ATP56548.1 hypothetical protein CPT03_08700 [Pedobacter ginsengisoli]